MSRRPSSSVVNGLPVKAPPAARLRQVLAAGLAAGLAEKQKAGTSTGASEEESKLKKKLSRVRDTYNGVWKVLKNLKPKLEDAVKDGGAELEVEEIVESINNQGVIQGLRDTVVSRDSEIQVWIDRLVAMSRALGDAEDDNNRAQAQYREALNRQRELQDRVKIATEAFNAKEKDYNELKVLQKQLSDAKNALEAARANADSAEDKLSDAETELNTGASKARKDLISDELESIQALASESLPEEQEFVNELVRETSKSSEDGSIDWSEWREVLDDAETVREELNTPDSDIETLTTDQMQKRMEASITVGNKLTTVMSIMQTYLPSPKVGAQMLLALLWYLAYQQMQQDSEEPQPRPSPGFYPMGPSGLL